MIYRTDVSGRAACLSPHRPERNAQAATPDLGSELVSSSREKHEANCWDIWENWPPSTEWRADHLMRAQADNSARDL